MILPLKLMNNKTIWGKTLAWHSNISLSIGLIIRSGQPWPLFVLNLNSLIISRKISNNIMQHSILLYAHILGKFQISYKILNMKQQHQCENHQYYSKRLTPDWRMPKLLSIVRNITTENCIVATTMSTNVSITCAIRINISIIDFLTFIYIDYIF